MRVPVRFWLILLCVSLKPVLAESPNPSSPPPPIEVQVISPQEFRGFLEGAYTKGVEDTQKRQRRTGCVGKLFITGVLVANAVLSYQWGHRNALLERQNVAVVQQDQAKQEIESLLKTLREEFDRSRQRTAEMSGILRRMMGESLEKALTLRETLATHQFTILAKIAFIQVQIEQIPPATLYDLLERAGLEKSLVDELREKGIFDGVEYWEVGDGQYDGEGYRMESKPPSDIQNKIKVPSHHGETNLFSFTFPEGSRDS